jgi:hypothetical protein
MTNLIALQVGRSGPSSVGLSGLEVKPDGRLGPASWRYSLTTADATPAVMVPVDPIVLLANTVYGFRGIVLARYAAASTAAAYLVQGGVKKGAANANTALVGTPLVTAYEDTAGMDLGITADTTNGRLILTATGVAATSILWYAELQYLELSAG